jgi:hypothetical protein
MSRVITRTGSINNYRAQSGKADSAKSRRIAFALFHRFKYPLSDDPADAVRTALGAELRTCQVERLIHYSGVAAVIGPSKLMYRCHSNPSCGREGAQKELLGGVINAVKFTDFEDRVMAATMPIEIFRGRVLSAEELAAIRREIESFDSIDAIDDEIRALIVRNWPDLAAKLPPSNE